LTKALQKEGRKYHILVNAVASVAGTQLTKQVMPADLYNMLKPEYTAPIVVYLSHRDCTEEGSIIECGGGWVGKVRLQRTHGVGFPLDPNVFTPEVVRIL